MMAKSTVNGPGERTVIWLQGCLFDCEGCFNPDFLPVYAGKEHTGQEVLDYIVSVKDVDGVTFSGGEPLAQATALFPVVAALKTIGKSIVIFTGFHVSRLWDNPDRKRVVECCDLVIAGPYRKDLRCSEPLRASSNQELVFVTDRFNADSLANQRQSQEFTIAADGTASVTGFPTL